MAAAERYLTMSARDLRLELEELYAEYAGCLDEDRFEDWPAFFTDDCIYKIIPRENFERGLPLALLNGLARDPLLLATSAQVMGMAQGELLQRSEMVAAVQGFSHY